MQAMGQFLAINQRTATDMLKVTGESLQSWMKLNQRYASQLSNRPGPQTLLQMNAQYTQDLLGEAWSDARKRADVVARASREFTALLTGGTTDSGTAPGPSAGKASAAVAELTTSAGAPPGEFKEAVQEALDDDLQQIDGIGSTMAATLRDGGINTIAELAMLDVASLEDEGHPLHDIAGRIVAGQWVEQARALSGMPAS